jgi:small nuclear ribonucleoprotein B and B'
MLLSVAYCPFHHTAYLPFPLLWLLLWSVPKPKQSSRSKLTQFINWRMRVTLSDTRSLVGTFLTFDRHMNLVLANCEEFRKIKNKATNGEEREMKRVLGLVILRGENVISITVDSPPLPQKRVPSIQAKGAAKPALVAAAGRGPVVAPQGLTAGALAGLGGPSQAAMMPAAPFGAGRGMAMPPVGLGVPHGMGRGMGF